MSRAPVAPIATIASPEPVACVLGRLSASSPELSGPRHHIDRRHRRATSGMTSFTSCRSRPRRTTSRPLGSGSSRSHRPCPPIASRPTEAGRPRRTSSGRWSRCRRRWSVGHISPVVRSRPPISLKSGPPRSKSRKNYVHTSLYRSTRGQSFFRPSHPSFSEQSSQQAEPYRRYWRQ